MKPAIPSPKVSLSALRNTLYPLLVRNRLFVKTLCLVICILALRQPVSGQWADLAATRFQNPYLCNPAMAGIANGLIINTDYQQQWTGITGSPKVMSFTAEYNAGLNVGLGLNINNDQAGLINRTRVMGTYAYHLPVNDNEAHINFGASVGFANAYIDNSNITGDQGDLSVQDFNQRNAISFESDLGVSYTTNALNLQLALPSVTSNYISSGLNKQIANRVTLFAAVSYKLFFQDRYSDYILEPQIALHKITDTGNILDIGSRFSIPIGKMDVMHNGPDAFTTVYYLSLTGVYHTNQSATLGIGFDLNKLGILLAYDKNTGPLQTNISNTFILGLKIKIGDN